ncbi:MAG: S8 family serine peptidase [Planctomycetota bacterium]
MKFRRNVADTAREQPWPESSARRLKLSTELDKLNARYRVRQIKPLLKHFRQNRSRVKALQQKSEMLLNSTERRILRRLKRVPQGAKVPDLDRIYLLDFEPGQSLARIVQEYRLCPDIEYAELNYIVSINLTPNDPLYPLQWSLNNTGQMYPESGNYNTPPGIPDCDIDAPEAWDIYTGSSETIVAVVDSGVDYRHRDLDDNMWVNIEEIAGNGVDDDNNGYVDDIYGYDFRNNDSDPCDDRGHGTHCAGTIAAEGDNGMDIAGVCLNARIMALKFLGSGGTGSTSDAVIAFYYAVENGADVISNSWGGGSYSYSLEQAIDYAHSQGVIMVASAGNDNSTSPKLPAYYEHVISVAATNSNDERATFSNYGDWVDIAAPGVDILSLRAENTSQGTPYDDYTRVGSGTSMACPHVAGACALLLSVNPQLTCDDVNDILMSTIDPIAPEICKSGRLNLVNAMLAVVSPKGSIILDRDYYSCDGTVNIYLSDINLRGNTTQQVSLATSGGDLETVLLTKTPPNIGIFTGTIPTDSGDPNVEDNVLQLSHSEIITTTYEDANDGTGNPATVEDSALADCVPPVIFNVLVERTGSVGARITFETDEPTTGRIRCDLACGQPYAFVGEDPELTTVHTVNISGLSRETSYYFIAEATDPAGNETTDDNSGSCYSFTTGVPGEVNVPGDFPTIQEAIDAVWEGDTVIVADGTYSGPGNFNIDFHGQVITVRSENGPENCIIDCNGSQEQPRRGFYFHTGEGPGSVLKGFTVTNGYAPDGEGGAIKCVESSPVIENCIFIRNSAVSYGGGMYIYDSNTILTGCMFIENLVLSDMYSPGGGMYNDYSSPTLIDCTFIRNSGWSYHDTLGGGLSSYQSTLNLLNCTFTENEGSIGAGAYNYHSDGIFTDCTFSNNLVHEGGGGMRNLDSDVILINCTFKDNLSDWYGAGGLQNGQGDATLINCTFSGNSTPGRGGGIQNGYDCSVEMTNCIFSGNSAYEGGGIHYSDGNSILINCAFSGNVATDKTGGAIYCSGGADLVLNSSTFAVNSALNGNALACDSHDQLYPSNLEIANCIIWDGGDSVWNNDNSVITITYSDVQGGWTGPGGNNIDIVPSFADLGYWAHVDDPNILVEPNDPNAFWIEGDYHLKSEAGRWEPNSQTWVKDDATSPCIDAGDPNSDWTQELWPHGERINMGAFGRTLQASMSLSDVGNIADLNNDGCVDYRDKILFVDRWLYEAVLLSEDLDRNGFVNFTDSAIFANNWRLPSIQASNPAPANHAKNIDVTFNLNWTAGPYATSHDVYFGTSRPPPFLCNQASTTFDAGIMASATKYYWRIDEVNPWATTTGTVWNFTTISLEATNLNPADGATEVSITADLSWTAGPYATSHDVYFGTSNPPPFIHNQAATTYVPGTMDYSTTYYWRIDEVSIYGTIPGTVYRFTTMALPLPTRATNSYPGDGSTDVSLNYDLSWTAGAYATSHDVYFGTSNPPPFIRNQTATTYDPGTMASGTMYIWRIDEVNSSGKTIGMVWYFTTIGPP